MRRFTTLAINRRGTKPFQINMNGIATRSKHCYLDFSALKKLMKVIPHLNYKTQDSIDGFLGQNSEIL